MTRAILRARAGAWFLEKLLRKMLRRQMGLPARLPKNQPLPHVTTVGHR